MHIGPDYRSLRLEFDERRDEIFGLRHTGCLPLPALPCRRPKSASGHFRPGRAGITSGHVRYAAKSGSKFKSISSTDNRPCSVLLSALLPQTTLLADRGYDADWIRELARQQGAWANIPPKRNRKDPICFSPYLYRARNLIERFFNKIKQCRRVATRYDKLAANYLAFVKLACIRICELMSPRPS